MHGCMALVLPFGSVAKWSCGGLQSRLRFRAQPPVMAAPAPSGETLTKGELRVLKLLALGLSNAEIARVNNQHAAACPHQLQGRSHSRIASADRNDVVVHDHFLLRPVAACRRAKSAARSARVISNKRFSSSASASANAPSIAAFTECSTRRCDASLRLPVANIAGSPRQTSLDSGSYS